MKIFLFPALPSSFFFFVSYQRRLLFFRQCALVVLFFSESNRTTSNPFGVSPQLPFEIGDYSPLFFSLECESLVLFLAKAGPFTPPSIEHFFLFSYVLCMVQFFFFLFPLEQIALLEILCLFVPP